MSLIYGRTIFDKRKGVFCGIIVFLLLASGVSGLSPMTVFDNGTEPVCINEIMYNPLGSDSGHEWIEVFSAADHAINISEWKFYESNANHGLTYIQGSKDLPPGGYVVICSDPTKFLADYPGYAGSLYDSSFSLSNSGEYLAIKDENGTVVNDVTYVPQDGADNTGMSLEFDGAASWYPSFVFGGTPGAKNSQATVMQVGKTVWDDGCWVESITSSVGAVLRFNLSIANIGSDFYILYNMIITDFLPQNLVYVGNATLNGVSRPPDSTSSGLIVWAIPVTEHFIEPGNTSYIEFDAQVVTPGACENVVNVSSEYCDPNILYVYGEDTVDILVPVTYEVCVSKRVRSAATQYFEYVSVPQYSFVTFNLTVDTMGDTTADLYILDMLPAGLSYDSNSATVNGVPHEPDIAGGCLWWNLTTVAGNTRIIVEFRARAEVLGDHINQVNVTAVTPYQTVYTEDTATVYCTEVVFNKQVWDPAQHLWVEELSASVGTILRMNLTLGYYGSSVFVYINISDELPASLHYLGNASTPETGYNPTTNTVWWEFLAICSGQSISIEFDVEVLTTGTAINVGRARGRECGSPSPTSVQDQLTIYSATTLIADAHGPYTGSINELIHIFGTATGGYPPYQYHWDLDNDGFYDDATGAHINHSWTNAGTHTIGVQVTDQHMFTATDTTTVIITGQGLIVDAGGPYEGIVNESIEISGTAEGGTEPYNYSWDLTQNGQYTDAYGDTITHSWETPGEYLISLKVTDANNTEGYDDATVIITQETLTANAGGPYQGLINQTIPLNGSATGGEPPYSYAWDLDNDSHYDDATGPTVNYSWNATGIYHINLQVTDSENTIANHTTTVTIVEANLEADAGGPYFGGLNTAVHIIGSATGGEPPYIYEWDTNNDGIYDDGNLKEIHPEFETPGIHLINLRVTDSLGLIAYNNTTVTIECVTLTINCPEPNSFYIMNRKIDLLSFGLIIGPITIETTTNTTLDYDLLIKVNNVEHYRSENNTGTTTFTCDYRNRCFGSFLVTVETIDQYDVHTQQTVSTSMLCLGRLLG